MIELKCPHCGSTNSHAVPQARQSGSAVGGLAGAALGMSGLLQGARAGATLGAAAGPFGFAIGGIGGALLGGVVGHFVGGAIGDEVDKRVLRIRQCEDCDTVFKLEQAVTAP